MTPYRIAGIILLVMGIALLLFGINASNSVADRWTNFFTGRFTDSTMWYMAVGLAAVVVGILVTVFGGRWAKRA